MTTDLQSVPAGRVAASSRDLVGSQVYRCRLAHDSRDIQRLQALRFEVFNVELGEGLAHSWQTGLDADPFDAVCEHLMVEDGNGEVVGTYRMQTGMRAQEAKGYYSEREFDFSKFSAAREQILELGRACIAKGHRNFSVLNLLWAGIAEHARDWGCRYLLGCSSYTTQDEAVGASVWHQLRSEHLAPTEWQTQPHAAFTCGLQSVAEVPPAVPRLLAAYLSLGARLCGPPAIDRDFKTIDFLTWLDLESPRLRALQARGRFLPRGLV